MEHGERSVSTVESGARRAASGERNLVVRLAFHMRADQTPTLIHSHPLLPSGLGWLESGGSSDRSSGRHHSAASVIFWEARFSI